jgi:hypothetical protein
MEPLEAIDALARVARSEAAPQTNVPIAAVIRTAQARTATQWRLAPLAWSAGISALAASVILVIALRQNTTSSVDPISPLFNAAQVQMP